MNGATSPIAAIVAFFAAVVFDALILVILDVILIASAALFGIGLAATALLHFAHAWDWV